jgi:toxin ParE1/3/4
MSSGDEPRYRLAPGALIDLDDVWRFSAETWSVDHADRHIDALLRVFVLIADMPTLARERTEFTPPVRIHVHQEQLIVYHIARDQVVILRVLGGRQDWAAILRAADL